MVDIPIINNNFVKVFKNPVGQIPAYTVCHWTGQKPFLFTVTWTVIKEVGW